ncbi:MAG: PH domain-containing protein [Candidatus Nanopelagicales bacterium]
MATPRRRTHPLTPLVSSVRTVGVLVGAILVFGGGNVRSIAEELGGLTGVLLILLTLVAILAVVLGISYLQWTRTEFFFDPSGDFRLDSGVVQRNERRVTLSRLQSVDTTRPLLGRVVGLSQVRIEVAGGGDSRVLLSYLADADAQALRAEIIARAAGMSPDAGEAPEAVLATVPTNDLVVSLLLRSETMILLLVSVVVVAGVVFTEGPAGLGLLIFTGGIPLLSVFTQFTRFFGFTVAESPDGLRLRHGLINQQSQTVPPGRVQAIEISEPLLWRRRGWVRVSLNVAGLQTGDDGQQENVLLPVAPQEVARAILARVLPGVDIGAMDFAPAPPRARRRAWLQFANLGVAHDGFVLAARRGFLTRYTAVIPHARTQSVNVSQGPWQRALGLASVQVDSTPGPVGVHVLHRSAGQARQIAEEQLIRASAARGSGLRERWMTVGTALPASVPPASVPATPPPPSAAPQATPAPGSGRTSTDIEPQPGAEALPAPGPDPEEAMPALEPDPEEAMPALEPDPRDVAMPAPERHPDDAGQFGSGPR